MPSYRLVRGHYHDPSSVIGEVAVFSDGAALLYRPDTEQTLALYDTTHQLLREQALLGPVHLECADGTPVALDPLPEPASGQNGASKKR